MLRILVIEKSPLVATDILETVEAEYPRVETIAVNSVDGAFEALSSPGIIDICIVSGSVAQDRLERLAGILDDRHVRTVAITDDQYDATVFAKGTVQVSTPFTSDMLVDAMRKINRDDPDCARLSGPE